MDNEHNNSVAIGIVYEYGLLFDVDEDARAFSVDFWAFLTGVHTVMPVYIEQRNVL